MAIQTLKISSELLQRKLGLLAEMEEEYSLWLPHFRDLALYFLPRQYQWLGRRLGAKGALSGSASSSALTVRPTAANVRKSKILNSAGTEALRTLAHGLMNGITSPARPWFRLRLTTFPGNDESYPQAVLAWLEECTRRMLLVLAESNFYTSQAIQYIDISLFGSSAMICYEDFEDVIRFYNLPMGEFNLMQSHRRAVDGMSRVFSLTTRQMVQEFGLEACSPEVQNEWKRGGGQHLNQHTIYYILEPNTDDEPSLYVGSRFSHREVFWEAAKTDGSLLRVAGYREFPLSAPRWEITGNDPYGTSPCMDALADNQQLQVAAKQRTMAKDKMIRPPLVADITLKGDNTAFLPGGVAFVPSASTIGARPVYTVQPPLGEMTAEINELIISIRRQLYNNLFRNVSDLDTVRSATEIAERKAEDMVMLGPVLERFENESLDPIIRRVFSIMFRKGLFPDPPPEVDLATLDIQYVSILADAQRAINTGSIERFMATVGQMAAVAPQVLMAVDFDQVLREYADRLNVPARVFRPREEVEALAEREQQQLEAQQQALVGKELTDAAKNLSETEVGSGKSALDQLLAIG